MVIAEAAAAAAAVAAINNDSQPATASLPPPATPSAPSSDIDLNCAEKVTDSDVEVDVDDSQITEQQTHPKFNLSVENDGTVASTDDSAATNAGGQAATNNSDSNRARDFTCKPKAIKAQRQAVDSTLLNYQQIPLYAFHSPKNPTGVSPFQPTGLLQTSSFSCRKSRTKWNSCKPMI